MPDIRTKLSGIMSAIELQEVTTTTTARRTTKQVAHKQADSTRHQRPKGDQLDYHLARRKRARYRRKKESLRLCEYSLDYYI